MSHRRNVYRNEMKLILFAIHELLQGKQQLMGQSFLPSLRNMIIRLFEIIYSHIVKILS